MFCLPGVSFPQHDAVIAALGHRHSDGEGRHPGLVHDGHVLLNGRLVLGVVHSHAAQVRHIVEDCVVGILQKVLVVDHGAEVSDGLVAPILLNALLERLLQILLSADHQSIPLGTGGGSLHHLVILRRGRTLLLVIIIRSHVLLSVITHDQFITELLCL